MTNEIKNELQSTIRYNEIKIAEGQKKLAENFCHYFAWNGEDLYKLIFITDHYKTILKDMDEFGVEEVMTEYITRFEKFVSELYNVRENCTGALHREVSTWKFVAKMEMIKFLKTISK